MDRAEKQRKRLRLEVKLLPVEPIPKYPWTKAENIIEAKQQSITITVHGSSVTNLMAQLWVSEQGPNYLEWRIPRQEFKPPEMVLTPGNQQAITEGKITISMRNMKADITKEDTAFLNVWHAWRVEGKKTTLNWNVDPIQGLFLDDHPAGSKLYMRIRFIADQEIAEGEEHHFILTFGGWEGVGLEVTSPQTLVLIKGMLSTITKTIPNPDFKPPESKRN